MAKKIKPVCLEKMVNPRWKYDRKSVRGMHGIIGVDEAGRGCLAGPVVSGAILLPKSFFDENKNRRITKEMNDSKQFDEGKREKLFEYVMQLAQANELVWGMGLATVEEIESENIVGATCLAMKRAMEEVSLHSGGQWSPVRINDESLFFGKGLNEVSSKWIVRVDGQVMKKLPYLHEGLVKGDTLSIAIAMASLVAKVSRDRMMRKLSVEFPKYDFGSNKGYGAPVHLNALKKYGSTIHHRPRFLRKILEKENSLVNERNLQTRLSLE